MGNFHLDFDESLSGLLDDGVEGTPFVGATIRIDRHKGLVVEIPYLLGTDNNSLNMCGGGSLRGRRRRIWSF